MEHLAQFKQYSLNNNRIRHVQVHRPTLQYLSSALVHLVEHTFFRATTYSIRFLLSCIILKNVSSWVFKNSTIIKVDFTR